MKRTTEAFARVKADKLLEDAGWNLTDGVSVRFEYSLPERTQSDYMLCDRQGRSMMALEAKRASTDPITGQNQGPHLTALSVAVMRLGLRPLFYAVPRADVATGVRLVSLHDVALVGEDAAEVMDEERVFRIAGLRHCCLNAVASLVPVEHGGGDSLPGHPTAARFRPDSTSRQRGVRLTVPP